MMSSPSAPVSRRQYKMGASQRQLKVELPWIADYIIVTNPNTQRLYIHSGSGEFPNKTNYDLMFPGQAKSQDGVESSYFGLTLGEPTDNPTDITETTVVVFVRGGSISAFGSMPIAPLATVSLAPGSTVGITGTPNVAVPGGVGIVGTPNVAVPGGAVVSGTVTNNPVQLNGVLQAFTAGFGVIGPTQFNHGWYDLTGWGGVLGHFENVSANDFLIQWYVSPNAGGVASVVKTWTIRPGQTLIIRVPKIERYVLFAMFQSAAVAMTWNAGIRATQETVFEPSVQMSGSMQDWRTNEINFVTAGTGLQNTGTTLTTNNEVMGCQVGHSAAIGTNVWLIVQIGNASLTVAYTLFRGFLEGGNTSGYINLATSNGGILVQAGISDKLLLDSQISTQVVGSIISRRRVFT